MHLRAQSRESQVCQCRILPILGPPAHTHMHKSYAIRRPRGPARALLGHLEPDVIAGDLLVEVVAVDGHHDIAQRLGEVESL